MFATEAGPESAEDEALDAVFTDAQLVQVQNNERAITQREKEINDIVKSLLGVADIFKELQTMVIDQGTVLDRIDYNIEATNVHVQEAHAQLKKMLTEICRTGPHIANPVEDHSCSPDSPEAPISPRIAEVPKGLDAKA
ncbi:hypothetical protein HDV00_003183 [Rhizophlyctis rosea]|nr:hypothetical protein HDV00_003183 [Rhizophlyctis rosea]